MTKMLRKYFGIALCFLSILHVSFNEEIQWKKGLPEEYEETDFQEADTIQKSTSYENISERHETSNNAVCRCDKGECMEENGTIVCQCPPEYGAVNPTICKECNCGKDSNCTFESYGLFIIKTRTLCICKKGYKTENEKCIGPCTTNPCVNGGTCVDVNKGYKCDCAPGFIGQNCTNLDYCAKKPCLNGGSCQNEKNSYKCLCPIGYSGDNCSTKECECENGECIKNSDGFVRCVCLPEYGKYTEYECRACECGIGYNCTFEVGFFNDEKYCICPYGQEKNEPCKVYCAKEPCLNGGTCQNEKNNYKCLCPIGFSGDNCDIKDYCVKKPCLNGGSCQNEENSYKCVCPIGYSGDNCTIKDYCAKQPCLNGGTCQNGKESYKCVCTKGYSGDNCETKECECENGECRKNSEGFFKCVCFPEYGKYTEYECKACECGKGYNCTFDVGFFNNDKYCICPYGQEKNEPCKDSCSSKPCRNGATCILGGNSFTCDCKSPYFGETCNEDPCTSKPCRNGGTCSLEGSSYKCYCKSQFFGKLCEEDACSTKPCQNGGTCSLNGNSYKCNCKSPYTGKQCEEDPCKFNPCKNGGICKFEENSLNCYCKAPNSGNMCENGPCTINPCHNNGTCSVDGYAYKCSCKAPYTGETCQEGPCTRNPCQNNGTCSVDVFSYKCSCRSPYFGEVCQEGPCTRNPCLNDGTCSVDGFAFKCACKTPYYGRVCQEECDCGDGLCRIDRNGKRICICGKNQKEHKGKCEDICSKKTCKHGECEIDGDDYYCRCEEGFTGRHCNERVQFKIRDTSLTIVIAVFCSIFVCAMFGIICLVLWRRRLDK